MTGAQNHEAGAVQATQINSARVPCGGGVGYSTPCSLLLVAQTTKNLCQILTKRKERRKPKEKERFHFFPRLHLEKGIALAASVLEQCPRKIAGKRKGR